MSSANWRDSILVVEARKTSCRIPLPLGLSQRGDNWPATELPLHLFSQPFLSTRGASGKEGLGDLSYGPVAGQL